MPRLPEIAAPTLAYLAKQVENIRFECHDCGRRSEVASVGLIVAYGQETPFSEIRRRAQRSRCGSKDVDVRPVFPNPLGTG